MGKKSIAITLLIAFAVVLIGQAVVISRAEAAVTSSQFGYTWEIISNYETNSSIRNDTELAIPYNYVYTQYANDLDITSSAYIFQYTWNGKKVVQLMFSTNGTKFDIQIINNNQIQVKSRGGVIPQLWLLDRNLSGTAVNDVGTSWKDISTAWSGYGTSVWYEMVTPKKVEYHAGMGQGLGWKTAVQFPYPVQWPPAKEFTYPGPLYIYIKGYDTYAVYQGGVLIQSGTVPVDGFIDILEENLVWKWHMNVSIAGNYQQGVTIPDQDWWDIPVRYISVEPYGYFATPGPNFNNYSGYYLIQGGVFNKPVGFIPYVRIWNVTTQQSIEVAVTLNSGYFELLWEITNYGEYGLALVLKNIEGVEVELQRINGHYLQAQTGTGPPAPPGQEDGVLAYVAYAFDTLMYWIKYPFIQIGNMVVSLTEIITNFTSETGALMSAVSAAFSYLPNDILSFIKAGIVCVIVAVLFKR